VPHFDELSQTLMSNWYCHLANSSNNVMLDSAHWSHGLKTWRPPYHNAVRGGLSHNHRQHAQKIVEVQPHVF